MKSTILIDARMYGLENAGIGRYIINLIEQLVNIDSGHKFVVLLRKKYFNKLDLGNNWFQILADFGHYGIEEQIRLPGLINSANPDLVHFPHLNIPVFWRGKFVVTIHDLTMHFQKTNATTLPLPIYYLKRVPYLFGSWSAVKNSQKIIVPSKFVKNQIEDYYKIDDTKLSVIYEGFENTKKSEDKADKILLKYGIKKPYFLYVGNGYPHKNLNRAIEATVYLNKHRAEKTYLILGGSRKIFKERLNNEIVLHNAQSFVKLIDFVEENDLKVLYKNSVGFLYPSLSEGFGLQGLEAMSSGTILLCSNIQVFKEIYGDFGVYFNPLDFSSIAASMKFALELEVEKREKLINASQEFIRKYSWKKMAKETLEVYNSVI